MLSHFKAMATAGERELLMGDRGDAVEKQKLVRLIHDLILQRVADAYGLAGLTLPRLLKKNKQSKSNPLLAGSLEACCWR